MLVVLRMLIKWRFKNCCWMRPLQLSPQVLLHALFPPPHLITHIVLDVLLIGRLHHTTPQHHLIPIHAIRNTNQHGPPCHEGNTHPSNSHQQLQGYQPFNLHCNPLSHNRTCNHQSNHGQPYMCQYQHTCRDEANVQDLHRPMITTSTHVQWWRKQECGPHCLFGVSLRWSSMLALSEHSFAGLKNVQV
jgi:hypothetical protein